MRYGVRYESSSNAFAEFASKKDAMVFLAIISAVEPGVRFAAFDVKTNEVVS